MAEKEAMVFVVDVGSSMAERRQGRNESDLDFAMRFVWSKLGDIAASGRKTLCAGLVGLRTDGTDNPLGDEEGYEHITVLQPLGPVSMNTIRGLQGSVGPNATWDGDAVSAVVVAIDMIENFTKKLKWVRRIYLLTDARGPIDPQDTEDIAKRMKESNIQLTVLGVDFDDAEYGFKEEDKDPAKRENEAHLRSLVDLCGDHATLAALAEAVDTLDTPGVKLVRPYKTYDGSLTLGNPDEFPSSVSINVERYFKTHRAAPPTANTVAVKGGGLGEGRPSSSGELAEAGDEPTEGGEFSGVKNARTYKVNDPTALAGKRDVDFEDLSKGYEYGRTAVHISEAEFNVTKLESDKSFTILGFVLREKFEPLLSMGEAGIIVHRKNDAQSQLALSSLVWALTELDSYAVARIVTKDRKDPLLILLAPCVEPGFEALYDIPLPFAEDVRGYLFPPLDRIITVFGATITKDHRLLPNDELTEAMSDYVDGMDLSTAALGDDGEILEYAQPDDVYNPTIHRLNHAIRTRALYPATPVPPIPEHLLRYASPPRSLLAKLQGEIDKLVETAEVKKVPPKTKSRRGRDVAKPISGLDVDALLGSRGQKRRPITRDNAVPEFKRALAAADQVPEIEDAARQMGEIVRGFVADSFGDALYGRALETLGTLRTGLLEMEEPGVYNRFVRDFKKRLISGELGGDRRDFWFTLKKGRLGLIDSAQSDASDVTAEEADQFYKSSR